MSTLATPLRHACFHPVRVDVEPAVENRNRLTTAFRLLLAPAAPRARRRPDRGNAVVVVGRARRRRADWGGGGVFGAVAAVIAVVAWFAILLTGRYPQGLWNLAAFYLRWRVRAVAYTALLRDEYPPFGDGGYPAAVEFTPPDAPRDRVTVAFRILLALPHIVACWALGTAWACTTVVAWFSILFTGRYPAGLHHFGVGVWRWNTRVEAYLLLLHDAYPPFSLE